MMIFIVIIYIYVYECMFLCKVTNKKLNLIVFYLYDLFVCQPSYKIIKNNNIMTSHLNKTI